MYKSAIGIFISNLLMIWIVVLNNEGPGWEAPASTMQNLGMATFFLIMSIIFTVITLLFGLRAFNDRTLKFKLSYFLNLLISIAFLIFLFSVEGFQCQFWFENFPEFIFIIISIGINVSLFALVTHFRFQNNEIHYKI